MSPSTSSSPFPPALPSSSVAPSSAAVDEEDLLALLASDTFSLESRRDKDLIVLSSFLKGVLPSAPSQASPPAGISIGSSAPAPPSWNGWRPDASTSSAPYGSPMSFQSTSSGSAAVPPAPSSSLNNHPSPPFPPNLAAAVLPLNFFPDHFASGAAGTSPRSPPAGPGGASGALSGAALSGSGASPASSPPRRRDTAGAEGGDRAPARGSFGASASAAAEEEAQGWKSRLRNSTMARRQEEEQARRAYQLQQDEDAMME
ncbi:hypothetical protein JCM21900_004373 [Sporobolomyces salmonicolor]